MRGFGHGGVDVTHNPGRYSGVRPYGAAKHPIASLPRLLRGREVAEEGEDFLQSG